MKLIDKLEEQAVAIFELAQDIAIHYYAKQMDWDSNTEQLALANALKAIEIARNMV